PVVGAVQVEEGDEMMMITDAGTLVRTRVAEVSQVGRNTQGVTLIRTSEDENVVALQRIDEVEEAEILDEETQEGEQASNESTDVDVNAADAEAKDVETPKADEEDSE
ncbi:MAG: DNA gyrase C-terminal beta-propeller domain-containing protein, partial [Vibrio gallaecicus]